MKNNIIIGINLGDFGSTGTIMRNSLEYANKKGDFDYLVIVPKDEGKPHTYAYFERNTILDKIDRHFIHRSIGNPDGFFEYKTTRRIIKKIDEKCKCYSNVIIHLHNIHMAFIDFRILFKYLAKNRKVVKIFYTLHDSWPYSGGCYVHINYGKHKCNKWQVGCSGKCIQEKGTKFFPPSKIWNLRNYYSSLLKNKMTLLPVSNWINNEVAKSFLKFFDSVVVYGETNITNLGYKDIDLINELSLNNKKVILTISSYWNEWKGYEYIYKIAKKLPDNYVILVVGGCFSVKDNRNIVNIKDVPNCELNHYYSIADVYMSTSQTESLGLTTCEAQICGVPVVAFGHAAVKETFSDKTGVLVGEDNDVDRMVNAIIDVVDNNRLKKKDIIEYGNRFKKYSASIKYFELYSKSI